MKMDNLFNNILTDVSDTITVGSSLTAIIIALVFGGAIAFTYYKTQSEDSYQRSMAVTLLMLPVILSVIILFVGSNMKRLIPASALIGALMVLCADIGVRMIPGGLPAGVVTALIGSPLFIYFLYRQRKQAAF